MHIVTGGAGFIGSAFVWRLNAAGIDDILIVDELGSDDKWRNLAGLGFRDYLHKDAFLARVEAGALDGVSSIVHMGACSSTTERDADYLARNNYAYTRTLAEWAARAGIRFVYASSAATYGGGEHGYSDAYECIPALRPLNMYGYSKQMFDLYALRSGLAARLAGVKFFNVYGPNEYHKGDMSSVIYKSFFQVRDQGVIRLFRSHRPDYGDGEQLRDFIYVKDCLDVLLWLVERPQVNGIFNLGTGRARTWNDLAAAVFDALEKPARIEYFDMPENLRDRYQYRTEAEMDKLRAAGYTAPFTALEDGVRDYVRNYLMKGPAYLER